MTYRESAIRLERHKRWLKKPGNAELHRARRHRHLGIAGVRGMTAKPDDNRCEICRWLAYYDLHEDHCHESGVHRGWLCIRCNTCLGVIEKAQRNGREPHLPHVEDWLIEKLLTYLGQSRPS